MLVRTKSVEQRKGLESVDAGSAWLAAYTPGNRRRRALASSAHQRQEQTKQHPANVAACIPSSTPARLRDVRLARSTRALAWCPPSLRSQACPRWHLSPACPTTKRTPSLKCSHHAQCLFFALCPFLVLTVRSFPAKIGRIRKKRTAALFHASARGKARRNTQRMGAEPCSDLQERTLRALVSSGEWLQAEPPANETTRKHAVCAPSCHHPD